MKRKKKSQFDSLQEGDGNKSDVLIGTESVSYDVSEGIPLDVNGDASFITESLKKKEERREKQYNDAMEVEKNAACVTEAEAVADPACAVTSAEGLDYVTGDSNNNAEVVCKSNKKHKRKVKQDDELNEQHDSNEAVEEDSALQEMNGMIASNEHLSEKKNRKKQKLEVLDPNDAFESIERPAPFSHRSIAKSEPVSGLDDLLEEKRVIGRGNTQKIEGTGLGDGDVPCRSVEALTDCLDPKAELPNCLGNLRRCDQQEGVATETKVEESNTSAASNMVVSANIVIEEIKEEKPQRILNGLFHANNTRVSRRKLLILDLNGLLVDIVPYKGCRREDMILSRKFVYRRPFVRRFIDFCFERFEVAIWSSRAKRNIGPLVEYLFGHSRRKLVFCWDLDQCTRTNFKTIENHDKPLVLKDLRRVWEKLEPNLPWRNGEYNESNTLLLDDSPYKAIRNPIYNAIFPYSYKHHMEDNSLGPRGDLRVYLENLALAENVQTFVKQNPFGQKPITKSDPLWNFYEKVLEEFPPLPPPPRKRPFVSRWDR